MKYSKNNYIVESFWLHYLKINDYDRKTKYIQHACHLNKVSSLTLRNYDINCMMKL